MIKQDICIHIPYSRPNGWTEWADFVLENPWVPWGKHRLKGSEICIFQKSNIFFKNQNFSFNFFLILRATPGPIASSTYMKK